MLWAAAAALSQPMNSESTLVLRSYISSWVASQTICALRVLATSSTDGLIELIPSMALEKILHDSPYRSINKYLAHYHPDPAGLRSPAPPPHPPFFCCISKYLAHCHLGPTGLRLPAYPCRQTLRATPQRQEEEEPSTSHPGVFTFLAASWMGGGAERVKGSSSSCLCLVARSIDLLGTHGESTCAICVPGRCPLSFAWS